VSENTTTCSDCGAEILARTSARTGGKCMPCVQGIRAQIEESKRRTAQERERERVNQTGLARIRARQFPTFGDFLAEEDPVGVLWQFLLSTVYREQTVKDVGALTGAAKNLYLVHVLDGEVFNGGFHQYFSNSSGDYAHEALSALLELGAGEAAKLLQQAIRAFPLERVSKERGERNEQLDHVDVKLLDALDAQYYALSDAGTEDLGTLIRAFMTRHAGEAVAAQQA
jgi:hypothetical protein